jgi:hypothetical protein
MNAVRIREFFTASGSYDESFRDNLGNHSLSRFFAEACWHDNIIVPKRFCVPWFS